MISITFSKTPKHGIRKYHIVAINQQTKYETLIA